MPDLALHGPGGNLVRLADLPGKSPVVLYFYPKDESFVCTREACGFRDRFAEFKALGAQVIGISADSPASHKRFAEHHQLPFLLLSDAQDEAFRAFGLKRFLGLKERATFVIGTDGVVHAAISHRLGAGKHVRRALEALRARAVSEGHPGS